MAIDDTNEMDQQLPPDADAHGTEGADQTSEADRVRFGMQKRIDALTASKHQQAAQIEMLQQQLTQQMAALTERMGAMAAQPQQEDPFQELDPTLAKALKYQAAHFEKKISEQQRMLETALASTQVAQIAQQVNLPPEIAERARAVLEGSRAKGLPLNAQDAADWAMGEAIRTGKWKPQAPTQQPPRAANGQYAPVNSVISSAPASGDGTSRMKPLPANFDSLSPDDQIRVLQARGADNIPL